MLILKRIGGVILPEGVRFGMVHIGFFNIPVCKHDKTIIRIKGTLELRGSAHFGRSSKVYVRESATSVCHQRRHSTVRKE